MSGVFLLTLVPDRSAPAIANRATEGAATSHAAVADEPPRSAEPTLAAATADLGRGTLAPLGGVGGPPGRAARHLPVERDGVTHFIPVDDVVAVHANAHYSYVFDGVAKLFCSLSIGEVESRLDKSRFARVHRSHIVNIERIVRLKRAGENGIIELAAAADRYTVPVSRARFGWLKSRLEPHADKAAV